jgi:hypothetical protein
MSRPKSSDAIVLGLTMDAGVAPIDPWEMRVPETDKIIDCSELKPWEALGEEAIRIKRLRIKAVSTHERGLEELREIFRALAEHCDSSRCPRPLSTDQLTEQMVAGTLNLIATKASCSVETRAERAATASALFRKLVKKRIPVPEFRPPHKRSRIPKTIKTLDAERIIELAKEDIIRIHSRITAGEAMFNQPAPPFGRRSEMSKSDMFSYWMHNLHGLPQSKQSIIEAEGRWFSAAAIRLKFNLFEMNELLYPTILDAIPFMLMLTKLRGLNVRGVLDQKTNSLINGTLRVVKKRGNDDDILMALSAEVLAEVEWVRNIWLGVTERGRKLAKPEDQEWFWLVLRGKDTEDGLIRPWHYYLGGKSILLKAIREWCDQRGISREVSGSLMGKLRKHAGSVVYKTAAAGDRSIAGQVHAIREAKQFLHHKDETPACYPLSFVSVFDVVHAINSSGLRVKDKLASYGVDRA